MPLPDAARHPIVFFDGVCGLCNRFVDWAIRRDRSARLRFAPLQGETARSVLGERDEDPERWSVVLVDAHGRHERSEATLRVLGHLGWPWRALAGLRVVPRFLRDPLYRAVARRRYRWFGEREACRLPKPGETDRFLD